MLKRFLLILFVVFVGMACNIMHTNQHSGYWHQKYKLNLANAPKEINDTTKYELLVSEPGFESWYKSHMKPLDYYDNEYLKHWNAVYTTHWNMKVNNFHYRVNHLNNPYDTYIYYDETENYDLEFNHKLYHFFQYIERKYGKIINYRLFNRLD